MKNLKLQLKVFCKNKFQLVFSLAVVLLFATFNIYSLIMCSLETNLSFIYMLSNIFQVLPYLVIMIIFLSFEMNNAVKNYYESVYVTKNNIKSVYRNQLVLLLSYTFLLFFIALFSNVVFCLINNDLSFNVIVHILKALILNFLLCLISSVFIGFLLSQVRIKYISYILIIIFALSETSLTDQWSSGIYNSFGFDCTKLLKFFNIVPISVGWLPNIHTGFVISVDKISKFLIFIALAVLVFNFAHSKRYFYVKKKTHILISAIILVASIVGTFSQFSTPNMDLSASGVAVDKKYYDSIEQIEKDVNFEIEKYNIRLSAFAVLKAEANIYLKENEETKYEFTLYHGYDISRITDSSGNELSYERNCDYLTVYGNELSFIKITYKGSCDKYYSNYSSVFLPGGFTFYPVPGFHIVYNTGNYGGFNKICLDYDVEYAVNIDCAKPIYSNLDESEKNNFTGYANSLMLIGGYIDEIKISDTTVYYPIFEKTYTQEYIKSKMEDFISRNSELKKIFIIPDINSMTVESANCFDNYFYTISLNGIDKVYFVSQINSSKLELYDVIEAYQNQPEYYNFLKEYSSDDLKKALPYIEKYLSEANSKEYLIYINKYLTDSKDNRSYVEFFSELEG